MAETCATSRARSTVRGMRALTSSGDATSVRDDVGPVRPVEPWPGADARGTTAGARPRARRSTRDAPATANLDAMGARASMALRLCGADKAWPLLKVPRDRNCAAVNVKFLSASKVFLAGRRHYSPPLT